MKRTNKIFLFLFICLSLTGNTYGQDSQEIDPFGVWEFNTRHEKNTLDSKLVISKNGLFGMVTIITYNKGTERVYSRGMWVKLEGTQNRYVLLLLEIEPDYMRDKIDFSSVPSLLDLFLQNSNELLISNNLMHRKYFRTLHASR